MSHPMNHQFNLFDVVSRLIQLCFDVFTVVFHRPQHDTVMRTICTFPSSDVVVRDGFRPVQYVRPNRNPIKRARECRRAAQHNLFWPVRPAYGVLRYLKVHLVQHDILWSLAWREGGALYAVLRNLLVLCTCVVGLRSAVQLLKNLY